MGFEPHFPSAAPPTLVAESASRIFAFLGQELVVVSSGGRRASVPGAAELLRANVDLAGAMPLGRLDGEPAAFCLIDDRDRASFVASLALVGLELRGLRGLFGAVDDATFSAAGFGAQLAHFEDTCRFCGRCATKLASKPTERAKRCPKCEREVYPHVSPCAIVLVEDRERDAVLLTRSPRFPPGMYGLVAGFLEPGETLEECAAREVREETGVAVEDVRYAGSQPWPFPSQLMVGFFATYAGGDLVVDTSELEDARWFTRDAMPQKPPPVSIARRLIDRWLAGER